MDFFLRYFLFSDSKILLFREIDLFYFTSFFGLDILKFSCQLYFILSAVCLLFLVSGAQCRPEEGVNPKEMINQLETKYKSLLKQWPAENENLQTVYLEWLGGKSTDKADHTLYTDYHEVEKMTNSLAIKW